MQVEFVSYDGSYPNLCAGTLIMKVDGKTWKFPNYCLNSGGGVSFDSDWSEHVTSGCWTISQWPEEYPEEAKQVTIELINTNVSHGCCGGCV